MHGPKNKIGILSLKDLWAVLKKKIFMNVTEIWDYPTFVLDCYSMELFKIDDPSTLNLVPGLKLAVTLCVQYTVGMWRAVPCRAVPVQVRQCRSVVQVTAQKLLSII